VRCQWLAVCGLFTACGSPPPPEAQVSGEAVAPTPAPEDSLALRTPDGVEVWFVAGRMAQDSAGRECRERSLEIRDGSGRRGVPLLYTREAPTVLDDSSVQARIFNHCAPGERYRISLRTGRPTPLQPR